MESKFTSFSRHVDCNRHDASLTLIRDHKSVDYSFTITLRPKIFTSETSVQYIETFEYVRRKLSGLSQDFTLIAEVTNSYNIHYHGIINFILAARGLPSERRKPDLMQRFHNYFRNDSIIGFVNIKQITDMPGWIAYLKKDLVRSYNCGIRPIIYDTFDIFDSEERSLFGVTW